MKLHLSGGAGLNLFSAYGDDHVIVNGTRHDRALIVLVDRIITDWPATSFAELTAAQLQPLTMLECEIIILGTGPKLRFPRPEITRPLVEAQIGLEVMGVPAACRTFNILAAEGRKVAAALLLA